MTDDSSLARFARDCRAHVPYAIIALLLLVSAIGLIISLDTRSSPDVEQDPALTMDRTEAALETVLRDAVRDASQQAAAEPVTVAADNEYGEALTPTGVDPGDGDPDEVFTRYVKLLIYQETQQRVSDAGQELRNGTHTEVRLPPIESGDDAEAAIGNVTLYVGGDQLNYGTSTSEAIGHGNVKVRIDGIEVSLISDGETLEERTMSLNTTVATPIFDVHERVNEYEGQLNMDFRGGNETTGLGDYVAEQAYPVAWTRGEAQAAGAPIANILDERHLEVLANEGIYETQERIFGEADRFQEQSLTRAWGSTLAQDYRGAYQDPDGDSSDVGNVVENVTDAEFVNDSNYIYDDIGVDHLRDELGDEPRTEELSWFNASMEDTHRVNLSQQAESVLGDLEKNHGIERAIDRIYEVGVWESSDIEENVKLGHPDGENTELVDRSVNVLDVDRVVDPALTDQDRAFYEIRLLFDGEYLRTNPDDGGAEQPARVEYYLSITVGGTHSPDDTVEQRGIVNDYRADGSDDVAFPDTNFRYNEAGADIPKRAVETQIEGVDDFDEFEAQFESYILSNSEGESSVLDGADLADLVLADPGQTVSPEPVSRVDLKGWLVQDLREMKREVGNVSTTFDTREMLAGNESDASTFHPLLDTINDDERWVYPHVGTHYENAPAKVRAEVRLAFIERLRNRVQTAITTHESLISEFDTQLESHTASNITATAEFSDNALAANLPDQPPALPSPELVDGIQIAPNAEPNYLTVHSVNLSQVSATGDPDVGFFPLAGRTDNRYAEQFNRGPSVRLRIAGEILRAAGTTDALVADPNWDGGQSSSLRLNLDNEISNIVTDAAATGSEPFPALSAAELRSVIESEVDNLGSVEQQAIMLGSGQEAVDRVALNASREFDIPEDPSYGYFEVDFRDHLESAIRAGLDESIGEGWTTAGTTADARTVAERIRSELNDRQQTVLQERLNRAHGESLDNTTATATAADWLATNQSRPEYAPNSVPSGRHVIGLPEWHRLTANLWHTTLVGEYPRFAVEATFGTNTDTGVMQYVREDTRVDRHFDGVDRYLGNVQKLTFEADTSVLVAVPPDSLGVGDRIAPPQRCTVSYDTAGGIDDETELNSCP